MVGEPTHLLKNKCVKIFDFSSHFLTFRATNKLNDYRSHQTKQRFLLYSFPEYANNKAEDIC